jgi:hypothetical protein
MRETTTATAAAASRDEDERRDPGATLAAGRAGPPASERLAGHAVLPPRSRTYHRDGETLAISAIIETIL